MNPLRFGAVNFMKQDRHYVHLKLTDTDIETYQSLKTPDNTVQIYANPTRKDFVFAYYPESNGNGLTRASSDTKPLFEKLIDSAIALPADLKTKLSQALDMQLSINAEK